MNTGRTESLRCMVGNCHCGRVQFEFYTDSRGAVSCNCTYCRRKVALHLRVPGDQFSIVRGSEALSSYRFGTRRAEHLFCRYCGVHTHCHPRSAPEQVNINLRCVDELAAVLDTIQTRHFDGLHWELGDHHK